MFVQIEVTRVGIAASAYCAAAYVYSKTERPLCSVYIHRLRLYTPSGVSLCFAGTRCNAIASHCSRGCEPKRRVFSLAGQLLLLLQLLAGYIIGIKDSTEGLGTVHGIFMGPAVLLLACKCSQHVCQVTWPLLVYGVLPYPARAACRILSCSI